MTKDNFALKSGVDGPARNFAAGVKSNTDDLPFLTQSIYVGSTGDLVLVSADSDDLVVWKNVPAGSLLPVRARRIHSTGTTASDLVITY